MSTVVVLFGVLGLAVVAWVLVTNARDRKRFEKELEEDLADDTDPRG